MLWDVVDLVDPFVHREWHDFKHEQPDFDEDVDSFDDSKPHCNGYADS